MSTRDEYVRRMQAKLDKWNSDIDTLAAKAGEISADARKEYNEQIKTLKAKQDLAHKKIAELQQTGEHAWQDLKSGIESVWIAIGEAVKTAKDRFK